MITVTLYKNTSDAKTIGKTLTEPLQLSATMRDSVDMLTPSFLVESGDSLSAYNYVAIPEFGRLYFATVEAVRTGLWRVTCRVDGLETYADEIRALVAVVKRQENKFNLFLNDGEWQTYANRQVVTRLFPSGFNEDVNCYYLTVLGGYESQPATLTLEMPEISDAESI